MSTELVIPPATPFKSLAQAKKALQTDDTRLHKHQAGIITSAITSGRALHYAQHQHGTSLLVAPSAVGEHLKAEEALAHLDKALKEYACPE